MPAWHHSRSPRQLTVHPGRAVAQRPNAAALRHVRQDVMAQGHGCSSAGWTAAEARQRAASGRQSLQQQHAAAVWSTPQPCSPATVCVRSGVVHMASAAHGLDMGMTRPSTRENSPANSRRVLPQGGHACAASIQRFWWSSQLASQLLRGPMGPCCLHGLKVIRLGRGRTGALSANCSVLDHVTLWFSNMLHRSRQATRPKFMPMCLKFGRINCKSNDHCIERPNQGIAVIVFGETRTNYWQSGIYHRLPCQCSFAPRSQPSYNPALYRRFCCSVQAMRQSFQNHC